MVDACRVGDENATPRDWWRLGVVIAAVLALVLGVVGFRAAAPELPPQEFLYGALQLFVLEGERL